MSWRVLSSLVRCDIIESASAITVRLAGEVDLCSSPQLIELLERAGRGRSRVVLDVRWVTFLDACGFSLLLHAARRLQELGGELVLRQPHRAVRRILDLSGGDAALAIEAPAAFEDLTRDVAAICSEAVDAAIGIGRSSTSHVRLADAADALRLIAARNILPEARDFFEVVDGAECAAGAAWAAGEMVHVPDVARSPIFAGAPSLDVVREVGIRSVGSIPLLGFGGRAVGTLSVGSDRSGAWSREQRRELRAVASRTGRLLAAAGRGRTRSEAP